MDDFRIKALEGDMRDVRDRLGQVEVGLGRVEARLDGVDERLGAVDRRLDTVEKRIAELPSKDFVRAEVMSASNRIVYWIIGASVFSPLMPQITTALKSVIGR